MGGKATVKDNGNGSEVEVEGAATEDVMAGYDNVNLQVELVMEDDLTNVRPWSSSDDESDEVLGLAESIRSTGQINPIEVRFDGATYKIMSGRRRLAAVRLINATEVMLVRCSVYHGMTDDDALKHAIQENAKRKDASALDNAQNIDNVRMRFGWQGGKHTKEVAEWFGMSPAWVTTHEKLLKLDDGLKSKVHQRVLSGPAAIELAQVKEEKRDEVLAEAVSLADKELPVTASTVQQAQENTELNSAETEGEGEGDGEGGGQRKKTSRKKALAAKVKGRHVRAAARNVPGASERGKSRSGKERAEFFGRFDTDAYGSESGPVRAFVQYWSKWCAGQGTDRTLQEKFDTVIETVLVIDQTAEAKVRVPAAKKAAKKAATKAKAKKKK